MGAETVLGGGHWRDGLAVRGVDADDAPTDLAWILLNPL
ncbi:hypothetical protein ATKI12_5535 [Kitasatospora sp. Ki12]